MMLQARLTAPSSLHQFEIQNKPIMLKNWSTDLPELFSRNCPWGLIFIHYYSNLVPPIELTALSQQYPNLRVDKVLRNTFAIPFLSLFSNLVLPLFHFSLKMDCSRNRSSNFKNSNLCHPDSNLIHSSTDTVGRYWFGRNGCLSNYVKHGFNFFQNLLFSISLLSLAITRSLLPLSGATYILIRP